MRTNKIRQILPLLMICGLVVSCRSQEGSGPNDGVVVTESPQPTALPTPEPPEQPTATATIEPTATLEPTATTEPTSTPEPTATRQPSFFTVGGFDFQQQGPVLNVGGGSAWDSGQTFMPDVFFDGELFHMFYVGFRGRQSDGGAIGYASSPDGISWTKHPDNPVLVGTAEFPNLVAPEVLFDGNQWLMYVNAGDNSSPIGPAILRATAPSVSGPWSLSEEPVLSQRGLRPWDRKSQPSTILPTDDGFAMYYMGVGGLGIQMGLATSPDGINWTRHDDPATTDRFDGSDPILAVGPAESWDLASAGTLEVIQNNGRWELFYTGTDTDPFAVTRDSILQKKPVGIGYATSEDGITWVKWDDNPVITISENCWPLLGTIVVDSTYYIYHDRNCGFEGIGVIQGTISR